MTARYDCHHSQQVETATCVGILLVWDPQTGTTFDPFKIYSNEEIYIGRDRKHCQYVVEDPVISNRHIRIYTIIYDQENLQEIAPLVYAQDISRNGTCWNGCRIVRGKGGVLLSRGDILQLSPSFYLQFQCNTSETIRPFDILQKREMQLFEDQYIITGRKLGSGAYGQVHMAIDRKKKQQLACKVVDIRLIKRKLLFSRPTESDHAQYVQKKLEAYYQEAEILRRIRHPNIIGLENVIKTPNTMLVVVSHSGEIC
ncbi:hypothetical protein Egran_00084 [Elaphomyces granulatus]|uniref:FHA domain-containing protein n=1 Tax=Elaphomyces granulatus TaxID=519963 RepID=A0A232M711_9EURO|nr:hypothetical protein Egran_00084 [Elaphomyces granulatus]